MSAVVREEFKPSVHHARLLADGKGPYGLCVNSDGEDDLPCVESDVEYDLPWLRPESSVVVRPDCVGPGSCLPTLFQLIPHGRHLWASGSESALVDRLHRLMLEDRDIEPPDKPDAEYWRRWHGLRRSATRVINSLLAEVYANIPTERLRIVRRYPIKLREGMYSGLYAAGDSAWQLVDIFPILAAWVYHLRQNSPSAKEALNLFKRGAKLRYIAEAAQVPMEFRIFKPMVTRWVIRADSGEFLRRHPYLVAHHCPQTAPRQRAWLQAISQAIVNPNTETVSDEDFAIWVASHYEQIGNWRDVPAIVGDVKDWVRASYQSRAAATIKPVEVERISAAMVATESAHTADYLRRWWDSINKSCEGRPFDENMAARTVLKLSHDWHERAAKAEAANLPFPKPWYDGDTINGHCIVPVKAADELSRYGYELHNCASQYSRHIANGDCFIYVVSKSDGKTVAMAEIARAKMPKLVQLKGPCNQAVAKPIRSAVRTWLTRQQRENGVGRMPARITNIGTPFDDGEIPF